jgi:transposase-like protein
MAPIDDAIAAIDARESEDDSTLTEIADKLGVDRSTLGRRCKGATTTQEAGYASQQKLNPQQELELVAYIEELTKRALPPTRAMIRNFALEVAKERVLES